MKSRKNPSPAPLRTEQRHGRRLPGYRFSPRHRKRARRPSCLESYCSSGNPKVMKSFSAITEFRSDSVSGRGQLGPPQPQTRTPPRRIEVVAHRRGRLGIGYWASRSEPAGCGSACPAPGDRLPAADDDFHHPLQRFQDRHQASVLPEGPRSALITPELGRRLVGIEPGFSIAVHGRRADDTLLITVEGTNGGTRHGINYIRRNPGNHPKTGGT